MRKLPLVWFVMMVLVLTACQGNKEDKQDKQDQPEDAAVEEEQGAQPADEEQEIAGLAGYSLDGSEIEEEPAGKLITEYFKDGDLADEKNYESAAETALDEYVRAVKGLETADWDADRWANSIIASLREEQGPDIAAVRNLKVEFEELKLPDGRLLQDVSEEDVKKEERPVNVAVLIDASGSMKADVKGGNKMQLAKESVKSFSANLPAAVNISLSVFGHKGAGTEADKAMSCGSIETVYPLEPFNEQKFFAALDSFTASGWTPLAGAIQLAEKDLLAATGNEDDTFIYVISDGIETCGGDPVEAARHAKNALTGLQLNIIGFDVDDEADRQLKEVAKAGGGEYTAAQDKQQLEELVNGSWKEQLDEHMWLFWNVHNTIDINGYANKISSEMDTYYYDGAKSRIRERDRMKNALQLIADNELADAPLVSEIRALLTERTEALSQHADQVRKEKHSEIFDTADRLRKLVDQLTEDAG